MPPPTPSVPADVIKTRKVELVLQQLDSLPTLPAIAVRLLALTGSSESKIQEVVQLLSADPALTGKMLSLAAAAGTRTPITSVQQAVVMLGFETVRNLVLSLKVYEAFSRGEETGGFERVEFWKHSLAVACGAELLAARVKPRLNPHDAFVCGLLHDIGKIAFDTAMPKSFARVVEAAKLTRADIADVERRIIGLDHALAGKRLAEAWNLPQLITQAIWLHNAPPPTSAGGSAKASGLISANLILVVALADLLVRRQHIGFSGNFVFPYEAGQFMEPLGLTPADVADVTGKLAEALESRGKTLGLYDVDSRRVYLESIANANTELGRVNQTLATQNRKLNARSACFEMMTKFYQRINPAASPAQLLAEIGNVAHAFLGASRLVLFSQDPDQASEANEETPAARIGEVLTYDASRSVQDSFLMPMPPRGGDLRAVSRGESNFIRPVLPQLEWLLERVQPFLGTSQAWFMPLLCGNDPVGGVLWVAPENENALAGLSDLVLVSQSWGMTLRTAQIREQQTVLTESLAAANRELGALQQQLVRAKSLAGLGEMAAGAAHEMNNPLAVVCGRAQLLAAKITDLGMKQEASLIAQQGERLSQIITDLMDFAKPQPPRPSLFSVKEMAEEAVKAAIERAGTAGAGAEIKVEVDPALPACRGDARQIKAALGEVVLNALQASKPSDTHEHPAAKHEVLVHAAHNPMEAQLIVQVIDHGVGMSEEVMRQAFSPFYSAKTAGRNRGMGLAKALRWVENHGGTIRLDSAVGAGTTAVIVLPLGSGEEEVVETKVVVREKAAVRV